MGGEEASSHPALPAAPRQLAKGPLSAVVTTLGLLLLGLLLAVPRFVRDLVAPLLPAPGTGPSDAQLARARYRYELVAETDEAQPRFARVRMSGEH